MNTGPLSVPGEEPEDAETGQPSALQARQARIGRLHGLAVLLLHGGLALGLLALNRPWLGLMAAMVAMAGLMAWRMMPSLVARPGGSAVALLSMLGLAWVLAGLGWMPGSAVVALMALHAAVAALLGGLLGAALALVAAALALGGLGWALLPAGAPEVAGAAQGLWRLGGDALVLLAGVAAGLLAARQLGRQAREDEEQRQRFARVLQIGADAYWELDVQGRLVTGHTEPELGRELGAEGLVGQVPWELPQFGCDPDLLDGLLADMQARERFRDVPVQWRGAGGTRHLRVSGEPRFDARGSFAGYWGVARDSTDNQRARQALAQTESRYNDLFVSLPTPLVLHQDGQVLDANPAAWMMFGHSERDTFLGSDLFEFHVGDEARANCRRRAEQLQAAAPGDTLPVLEFELLTRSGRSLSVRSTGVAMATPQGPGVLSIYVDDTERRATELAVRRSEAMLSHLVASSADLIALQDLTNGRFLMANQAFEEVTGWTQGSAIGRSVKELGLWASATQHEAFRQAVRDRPRLQEWPMRLVRRDGQHLPMLLSAARFSMDGREYLVVNGRDISDAERVRIEREAILDNASIGIALTRDRRFQLANPALEAMVGWPRGALVGQPLSAIWPDSEAYAEAEARHCEALRRGEQVEMEGEFRCRDGSRVTCRMLARAVDRAQPGPGGTIWIIEDVTERRRVHEALTRAREDADAAQRAKSAFLANASHELRTPLHQLVGLTAMARPQDLEPALRADYLNRIADSARALARVVTDILDLSTIEDGRLVLEPAPFDLPVLLQALRQAHAAPAAERGLGLELTVDPGLGQVLGDDQRVGQILHNYLGNAVKFCAQGVIRLTARRAGGDRVRFEVHDSGPGIDEATRARLFKPFNQADESNTRRFGGAGLGLSICRRLATLMGGVVGVDSRPGAGSCFWAELPLPPALRPTVAEAELADEVPAGARVLVVDDNEVNLMVAVRQLQLLGLRVDEAADGQQALRATALAEAAGDPYRLVMMDLQMPGISGFEAAQQLRRTHGPAQLPIVAWTAAVLPAERDAALAAGMNDFLSKPTGDVLLRRCVARWLRCCSA